MHTKIISLKRKTANFRDLIQLKPLNNLMVAFDDINSAIKGMEFNGVEPLNHYFIKSINAVIFPEHSFLYPYLRFLQYANAVPKNNLCITNWDGHSDFYCSSGDSDISNFEDWGVVHNVDWKSPEEEFITSTINHSINHVSIASFLYPLIWTGDVSTYIWRGYPFLLTRSPKKQEISFSFNQNARRFSPEHHRLHDSRSTTTVKTTYIDASNSGQDDFRSIITKNKGQNHIHSVDVDVFFTSERSSFSKRNFRKFQDDIDKIMMYPSIKPSAIMIATSPGFTNGKYAQEAVNSVLEIYKFLEAHQLSESEVEFVK